MLDHVRERLLHDPVGGELESRGERPRIALDRERHLEAARANLLGEFGDLAQAGLRRARGRGRVGAEDAEQPAHLGQRLAARGRDRVEHGRRRVRRIDAASQRPGLHDHQTDVVGDHVVQLARDAGALVDRGLGGELLALLLGALGSHRELLDVGSPRADVEAERRHGAEQDERRGWSRPAGRCPRSGGRRSSPRPPRRLRAAHSPCSSARRRCRARPRPRPPETLMPPTATTASDAAHVIPSTTSGARRRHQSAARRRARCRAGRAASARLGSLPSVPTTVKPSSDGDHRAIGEARGRPQARGQHAGKRGRRRRAAAERPVCVQRHDTSSVAPLRRRAYARATHRRRSG